MKECVIWRCMQKLVRVKVLVVIGSILKVLSVATIDPKLSYFLGLETEVGMYHGIIPIPCHGIIQIPHHGIIQIPYHGTRYTILARSRITLNTSVPGYEACVL